MSQLASGAPDVAPDTPSHTPGSGEGNAPGSYEKQAGLERDGRHTPRRSTGIRPGAAETVVPGSPQLSPA